MAADVRLGGDRRRRWRRIGELVGRLEEPHLVQGQARVARGAPARAGRAARQRAARPSRRNDGGVLAPARARTDSAARRRRRAISASLVVELVDWERGVGAEAWPPRPRRRRAGRSRSPPPGSRGRTNSTNGVVGCPGRSRTAAPGSREAGQVEDVAVLPELVVSVAVAQPLGRRHQQQRGAAGPAGRRGARGVRRRWKGASTVLNTGATAMLGNFSL